MPESPPARPNRPAAAKHDPKMIAAARELRDRYLEEINSGRLVPPARGKYNVTRALPGPAILTPAEASAALPAPVAA